jgi:hypothetical protein
VSDDRPDAEGLFAVLNVGSRTMPGQALHLVCENPICAYF